MKNLTIEYHKGNLPKEDADYLYNTIANYGKEKFNLEPNGGSYGFVLKDEKGKIYGGLTCNHIYDEFKVRLLGVDEGLRGQGYGRKLMAEAEKLAKKLGFTRVLVITFEFQAPKFYQKCGYEIEFVRENENELLKRYYLVKRV